MKEILGKTRISLLLYLYQFINKKEKKNLLFKHIFILSSNKIDKVGSQSVERLHTTKECPDKVDIMPVRVNFIPEVYVCSLPNMKTRDFVFGVSILLFSSLISLKSGERIR